MGFTAVRICSEIVLDGNFKNKKILRQVVTTSKFLSLRNNFSNEKALKEFFMRRKTTHDF